jgi:hypothetical protein
MKYLVEINADSIKGSKLLKYIEDLGVSKKDVHVLNEAPLTDKEMGAPPTRRVSKATLESWLKPGDNEEGLTAKKALIYLRKKRRKPKR